MSVVFTEPLVLCWDKSEQLSIRGFSKVIDCIEIHVGVLN